MKKLLSILGMTNFIVIGTSLIISCSNKLTKPIEQPKIDISSSIVSQFNHQQKLLLKTPLKVDLTEVKNALKP
ncbi:hypothetical protein [Spiroplasma endosymbiont of Agriotes lineatus]|uniref:hypothetical protein n=1 Tax=Spiroplasma endosymbiont of Agriotes lineatus TaxID=3077930 RepID=UPI0030D2602D